MTKKRKFNFELGFNRVYKDGEGKMHVVGVASDTSPDLQGDRMSKEALDDMASQLEDGIDMLDSHRSTFGFGKTIGGVVTKKDNEYELVIDAELDSRFPQAEQLYNCIENGTCDKQMSIGGEIDMEKKDAITFEERNDGSFVRVINSINLDHIATTRKDRAANPRTKFMQAILKDIIGDEELTPLTLSKEIEDAKTDETKTNDVAKETPETQPSDEMVKNPVEKGICPHCNAKCSTTVMQKEDWACQNCFGSLEEWELHKDTNVTNIVAFKSFPIVEPFSEEDKSISEKDVQILGKDKEVYKDAHLLVVGEESKLVHHKMVGETLKTSFNGVISCVASMIQGSFKSVDIDENARSHAFAHLSRHIREFNMDSPTLKEFTNFKEVDEFIIWMARKNNLDISFAKDVEEITDLGCFGKTTEKSQAQVAQDDVNTALSFFSQVGRDLRTEKSDGIDPVLSAFAKKTEVPSETKTEKEDVDMGKTKETTTDEPLVLGKDSTPDLIFKSMNWLMGNIRAANLSKQPDLAEKMRNYFSSFQQLLAEDGILKKDNVDETTTTQETTQETTNTDEETTQENTETTSDPVTEKSVQELVEQASPLIAANLAELMKDSFTPEAVMGAYKETFEKSLDTSLEKSVTTLSSKIENISKNVAKQEDRIGKVEKVSGTKQSVPENGTTTTTEKDRKPSSQNPFKGFWDGSIQKAMNTLGTNQK